MKRAAKPRQRKASGGTSWIVMPPNPTRRKILRGEAQLSNTAASADDPRFQSAGLQNQIGNTKCKVDREGQESGSHQTHE
jgi:hypothetical protein